MSSVAAAHMMTRELADWLAPSMPAKVKQDRLHREIAKRLPSVSRRRVRALFFGEVARIDYDEMRVLEEMRAEEELKRARRQLAASAIVLAAHHEQAGETLARDELLAVGRRHGAVDLPGNVGGAR